MVDARSSDYDAIVIGGGPSGCAYALTLVRGGHSVLLLEREKFPRFHIGESFLPYTNDVLEQLGLLQRVCDGGFVVKRGVELTDTDGTFRRVDLEEIGDGYTKWSLQVERSHFDKIVLDATAESGVTVFEEARVTQPVLSGERVAGVQYRRHGEQQTATARLVVDASGRAGVIPRALGLRKADNHLKMAAVYKHFGGLDERNNPGVEGDIQLGRHENGWLWAIPIRPDTISIGAMTPAEVLRGARPEEVFNIHLQRIPRICDRIKGTEVIRDLSGEQNFEYHSDVLAGPGYIVVGDAGCFTDPVFSGGVFLALATGRRAAEESARWLDGEIAEAEAAKRYGSFFKTGYSTYYRLIRAVYDTRCYVDDRYPVMFQFIRKLLSETSIDEKWRVRALSGDFWTEDNPFVNRLRSEEGWDLFDSFEPMYGCPVYGTR
jgi:flavin-dependent dehydrogenase